MKKGTFECVEYGHGRQQFECDEQGDGCADGEVGAREEWFGEVPYFEVGQCVLHYLLYTYKSKLSNGCILVYKKSNLNRSTANNYNPNQKC